MSESPINTTINRGWGETQRQREFTHNANIESKQDIHSSPKTPDNPPEKSPLPASSGRKRRREQAKQVNFLNPRKKRRLLDNNVNNPTHSLALDI